MKLHKLSCPNCNGILDIKLGDKEYIFCPYCGQKFFIESGKKEYSINQNIHIKKDININKTNRTINDADVIRAQTEAREKKYSWVSWVGLVIAFIALEAFCWWMSGSEEREAKKALAAGLISAGADEDYVGENYAVVVEQLETLGFTNVTTVDLDDSGVAFWKADNVDSVSIGGDTSFYSDDYFEPDVAIIVKYH